MLRKLLLELLLDIAIQLCARYDLPDGGTSSQMKAPQGVDISFSLAEASKVNTAFSVFSSLLLSIQGISWQAFQRDCTVHQTRT